MNINIYKKQSMLAISFLLLFVISCSADSENEEELTQDPPVEGKIPVIETVQIKDITTSSALVIGKITDKGTSMVTERGACFSTSGTPTLDDISVKASKVRGSGEFEVQLYNLENDVVYKLRAYAKNQQGIAYDNQVEFKTDKADVPTIKTSTITVAGAQVAFVNAELLTEGGNQVIEKGICWSEEDLPTIEDTKLDLTEDNNSFKAKMEGLNSDTKYFVRSYAINSEGIGYSDQVEVNTISEGNVTYTIHKDSNPSEELQATYERLEEAFKDATHYYNKFTSINKHVDVYYNASVPTADGHINGTIRVGSNISYQKTGTAMHEIMHTVGVGQHWRWNELISGGAWNGSRANEILQVMTDDSDAVVKGDNLHFWPYGINGAHEDTGEEMLYIIHALILQGMKTDGLPSDN